MSDIRFMQIVLTGVILLGALSVGRIPARPHDPVTITLPRADAEVLRVLAHGDHAHHVADLLHDDTTSVLTDTTSVLTEGEIRLSLERSALALDEALSHALDQP